ncbi:chromate transporter [Chromobacterium sphagni]|uniref:Chromate transporter n=1 Tax=Chromobacterium sphagni TaxID=1903179 RepID=A0A1S1X3L5_9NEIS|nr:chromate transporter [Chromobacterium sphagni]OHX14069.1 chromate transporter [Chromobacterium sphagni]OHX20276.1 chromate transporter [Chromobacterium sphagni]
MNTELIKPRRRDLFAGFFSVGITGFGGVLPQAHSMLVQRRRWLSEADFAEQLGLCQVLPGPNIVNMAVSVGARFHGVAGSMLAVAGLLLAPMAIVLLLGTLYGRYRQLPLVEQVMHGLAAAAAGLLLAMLLRLLSRLERHAWSVAVMACTFAAIAVWRLPLPWVLLAALPLTLWLAWLTRRGSAP